MSDFSDIDPSLVRELDAQSVEREQRVAQVLNRYRAFGYFFVCDDLTEGDVLKVELPKVAFEGMSVVAVPRTLSGEVVASAIAVQIEHDTAPPDMNLVGETIIPGGWGNPNFTKRGGYFPNMLTHGFAFGYHILGESRSNAENLLVPYSRLEVNGITFFDRGEQA